MPRESLQLSSEFNTRYTKVPDGVPVARREGSRSIEIWESRPARAKGTARLARDCPAKLFHQ